MASCRNPDGLLIFIFIRFISEEYIDGTVVEYNDELIRVLTLDHGFKPLDMGD